MNQSISSVTLLQAFADGLRQLAGESIDRILVIGSYARGDQTKESDIDVVVLLKTSSRALRNSIYDYLVDFVLEHDVDISLKLLDQITYQEWTQKGEPLVRAIETEGIAI